METRRLESWYRERRTSPGNSGALLRVDDVWCALFSISTGVREWEGTGSEALPDNIFGLGVRHSVDAGEVDHTRGLYSVIGEKYGCLLDFQDGVLH